MAEKHLWVDGLHLALRHKQKAVIVTLKVFRVELSLALQSFSLDREEMERLSEKEVRPLGT